MIGEKLMTKHTCLVQMSQSMHQCWLCPEDHNPRLEKLLPAPTLFLFLSEQIMLNYRNTPLRNTGCSPAQIVTGRKLRDHLATNPESYKPSKEWQVIKEQEILLLSSPSFRALICLGKPQV